MSHKPFEIPTTPEAVAAFEAELEANAIPMSDAEFDQLTRRTFILVGIVPVVDMTPEEVEWHLRHRVRFAP